MFDAGFFAIIKKYVNGIALNGVPVNYPQVDPVTKHWRIFNPVGNTYVDTGIIAEGKDGVTPSIGNNGNWFIGTTDTGILAEGKDGKSAYQVAVDNGFAGTEAEWLESLNGEQGDPGEGVPVGGNAGQVLRKKSANDYDTEWDDESVDDTSGYEPPAEGIPKEDLSSEVQSLLNKADTALQSFTETDPVYTQDKPNIALKADFKPIATFYIDTNVDYNDFQDGSDTYPYKTLQQVTAQVWGEQIPDVRCIVKAGSDLSNATVVFTNVQRVVMEAPATPYIHMVKVGAVTIEGSVEEIGMSGFEILGALTTSVPSGRFTFEKCILRQNVINLGGDGVLMSFFDCGFFGDISITGTGGGEVDIVTCRSYLKDNNGNVAVVTLNDSSATLLVAESYDIPLNVLQGSLVRVRNTILRPSSQIGNNALYIDDNYAGEINLISGTTYDPSIDALAPVYIGQNCRFSLGAFIFNKNNSQIKGAAVTTGLMAVQLRDYNVRQGFQPVIRGDDDFGQRVEANTIRDQLNGVSDEFVKRNIDPNDEWLVQNGVVDANGNWVFGGLRADFNITEETVYDIDGTTVIGTDIVFKNKNGDEKGRVEKTRPNSGGGGASVNFVNSQTIAFSGDNAAKQANVQVDSAAGLAANANGVSVDPNYKIPTADDASKLAALPTNAELEAALGDKQPHAPAGYGFSQNNYSNEAQTKLASIPAPNSLATKDSNGRVADSNAIGGAGANQIWQRVVFDNSGLAYTTFYQYMQDFWADANNPRNVSFIVGNANDQAAVLTDLPFTPVNTAGRAVVNCEFVTSSNGIQYGRVEIIQQSTGAKWLGYIGGSALTWQQVATRDWATPKTSGSVGADDDLNDYTTSSHVGPWSVSSAVSSTALNVPVAGVSAKLIVYSSPGSSDDVVTQLYITNPNSSTSKPAVYLRTRNVYWTSWVQILTQDGVYSTTETNTGKKWIDGKPIYRRVLTGNIVAAANTLTNTTLISSGVDSLVASGGWLNNGSASKISLGQATAQGTFPQLETQSAVYANSSGAVVLQTTTIVARAGTTNNAYQVWVEYTKT